MKDINLAPSIKFLSEFTPSSNSCSIFEGLWEKWKQCEFHIFYQCIRKEIERFFNDPEYSIKDVNYRFFCRFISNINEYHDVDRAFLHAGGLSTRYGIIWIRYKIQDYYNTHKKIPTPINLTFLQTYFGSREYEKYGYSSWDQLISKNIPVSILEEHRKNNLRKMLNVSRLRKPRDNAISTNTLLASRKLNNPVWCESSLERDVAYLLDHHPQDREYCEQAIELKKGGA